MQRARRQKAPESLGRFNAEPELARSLDVGWDPRSMHHERAPACVAGSHHEKRRMA